MPSGTEGLGVSSPMQAVLDAGVEQLAARESVSFRLYTKVALAPDSSIFWVASPTYMTATGSLHFATDRTQDEDQTIGANHVLFTSEVEVTAFNNLAPGTMWIGTWPSDGGTALQVVFGQRGGYFREADLFHYSGYAVYPAMSAQIVATSGDLPTGPIVSNSLPIWLSQSEFAPVYPSFLVPDNIVPPYIVAHVEPSGTDALGGFPLETWPGDTEAGTGASPLHNLPSTQLMRDEVTLTLYGFTNHAAIQYLRSLIDFSLTDAFGWANTPAIRDEKRRQVELAAVAQKKSIHVSANYLQWTADAIARRLILSATVSSVTAAGGVA